MRTSVAMKSALTESERFFEEDPYTERLIDSLPITLVAHDSRYEYDLNRPVATCIYNKAWGKTVWSRKLTPKERMVSITKHQTFYRIVDALVVQLEKQFGEVLMMDVHSYNHVRRTEAIVPTFNIGSEQIDRDRWRFVINKALISLGHIRLPNIPVLAKENSVFFGRGYLASHINSRFQNTLVLPVEVKKIFMDEVSGEVYPLVLSELEQQFKASLLEISRVFMKKRGKSKNLHRLQTGQIEPSVLEVDSKLFGLAKTLETLYYINPINIPAARKQFFKGNGRSIPSFAYRQLDIDPYWFRQQLYKLPVQTIRDPMVQGLYRDVIDSIGDKIDMLVKAGQDNFLYESLCYYGEPSENDVKNALFILHAQDEERTQAENLQADDVLALMKRAADAWQMPCKVEKTSRIAAAAMVGNAKRVVYINTDISVSEQEANALVQHELGVHMATTLNARAQKLKLFSLGLPGNTYAQEGLAILNELQSGNMSLHRLKTLALRVLAVKEMIKEGDFRHTFAFLHEQHQLSQDQAFKLATRVHRGGGFTKDYLYLSGLGQALDLYKKRNISNLYIGKTGFKHLNTLDELVSRGWAQAPNYVPTYLKEPVPNDDVLDYLITCIKPSANTVRLSPSLVDVA